MSKAYLVALSALALLVGASGLGAQSDSELRKENQRLQTQLSDLERELEAAQNRIAQLEDEVRQLRRLLAAAPAPVPAPPPDAAAPTREDVSIDESVPNASPRALLNALRESYDAETRDLEMGSFGDLASQRQRAAYLRAVSSWARRVNREMKSQVQWHVRMLPASRRASDEAGLVFVAIDPESHVELGDPFRITLPKSARHRLVQLERRGPVDVLLLRGVLVPQVGVNETRQSPGPFDNPRFIGPFAEFGMIVQGSSVVEVRDKPKEEAISH